MFNLFLVIITSLNSLYDDYAKYADEVKKVYEVFGESVGNAWTKGVQKKAEAVFDKFPKFSLDSMKTESIVKSILKGTTKTDAFMKNWKDSAKTYIKKNFWQLELYVITLGKLAQESLLICEFPQKDLKTETLFNAKRTPLCCTTYIKRAKEDIEEKIIFQTKTIKETCHIYFYKEDTGSVKFFFLLVPPDDNLSEDDYFFIPYIDASQSFNVNKNFIRNLVQNEEVISRSSSEDYFYAFGGSIKEIFNKDIANKIFQADKNIKRKTRIDSLFASFGEDKHINTAKREGKKAIVFLVFTDGAHDTTEQQGIRDVTKDCEPGGKVYQIFRQKLYESFYKCWKEGLFPILLPIFISTAPCETDEDFLRCREWVNKVWKPLLKYANPGKSVETFLLREGRYELYPLCTQDTIAVQEEFLRILDNLFTFWVRKISFSFHDLIIECRPISEKDRILSNSQNEVKANLFCGGEKNIISIENIFDPVKEEKEFTESFSLLSAKINAHKNFSIIYDKLKPLEIVKEWWSNNFKPQNKKIRTIATFLPEAPSAFLYHPQQNTCWGPPEPLSKSITLSFIKVVGASIEVERGCYNVIIQEKLFLLTPLLTSILLIIIFVITFLLALSCGIQWRKSKQQLKNSNQTNTTNNGHRNFPQKVINWVFTHRKIILLFATGVIFSLLPWNLYYWWWIPIGIIISLLFYTFIYRRQQISIEFGESSNCWNSLKEKIDKNQKNFESFKGKLICDIISKALIFRGIMSLKEKNNLSNLLTSDNVYKEAIEKLFLKSQQREASLLFFISLFFLVFLSLLFLNIINFLSANFLYHILTKIILGVVLPVIIVCVWSLIVSLIS